MKIYLTGGSGKLGKAVVEELKKNNTKPILLSRRKTNLENEIVVNFKDKEKLRKVLSDCDVLIHLAGSTKFYDKKNLLEGNVELTRNLVEALPKDAKIVFASSVSVYGKKVNGIISENTEISPDSEYAKSKAEAEKIIIERGNYVILRIGPIYGKEFEDYKKFLKLIKMGLMVIFGNGKNRVSFIHVEDVAKAIVSAINKKNEIYILSGESLEQEEIYSICAKYLKVEKPKLKIPIEVALFVAYLIEKISLLFNLKPFITREHILILSSDRIFNYSKAEKELGFRPKKLEDGIKELIDHYKNL